VLGVATLAYGSFGALSCKALDRLASYLILVSAGTLLLAVAYNSPGVTAGALYYIVAATLVAGALFLLKDVIDQVLPAEAQVLAVSLELYGDEEETLDEDQEVSRTIPAAATLLSWCFAIAALVMAGLPPLPGFIAKFAMISQAFGAEGAPTSATWWMTGALILSGLLVLVAMVRNGINIFWASLPEDNVLHLRPLEIAPIVALLALSVLLAVAAGPAMGFFTETAAFIHAPQGYVDMVLPKGGPALGACFPIRCWRACCSASGCRCSNRSGWATSCSAGSWPSPPRPWPAPSLLSRSASAVRSSWFNSPSSPGWTSSSPT